MPIKFSSRTAHSDLIKTQELVYSACNFTFSLITIESESDKYGACIFEINDFKAIFRVAKITPKKVGQFVTLWKRIKKGPTQPYDACDAIDLVIISTKNDNYFGQFVFPKPILLKKNIFSINGKSRKRGIRVYPPWDKTINQQAQKTQEWQLKYFLEIPINNPIDYARTKILYLNS